MITANNIIELTEATSNKSQKLDYNKMLELLLHDVKKRCSVPGIISYRSKLKTGFHIKFELKLIDQSEPIGVKLDVCSKFYDDKDLKKTIDVEYKTISNYNTIRNSVGVFVNHGWDFQVPGIYFIVSVAQDKGIVAAMFSMSKDILLSYAQRAFQLDNAIVHVFDAIGKVVNRLITKPKPLDNLPNEVSRKSGIKVIEDPYWVFPDTIILKNIVPLNKEEPEDYLLKLSNEITNKRHTPIVALNSLGFKETDFADVGNPEILLLHQLDYNDTQLSIYIDFSDSKSISIKVSVEPKYAVYNMSEPILKEFIDAISDVFAGYNKIIKKFIDSNKQEVW